VPPPGRPGAPPPPPPPPPPTPPPPPPPPPPRAVAHGAREVGTRELTRRMTGPRGERVRARRAARGR
jgi:hypothetical protein